MRSLRASVRRGVGAALAVAVALALAGVPSSGAQAADGDNTLALVIEPAVPSENAVFQVRASGIATASQSGNIYLAVSMAPAEVDCYSTSELEQSRAESGTYAYDPRWEFFGAAFVAGNNPDHEAFLESKVISKRPAGRYRLCGYLRGQGQGPDPYVATRLDFTIGGTCATATGELSAAQAAYGTAQAAVTKAASAATKASAKVKKITKKQVKPAKKAVKAAKKKLKRSDTNANAVKLAKAKKQLKAAKKKKTKARAKATAAQTQLAAAEAASASAVTALATAQERSSLLCP